MRQPLVTVVIPVYNIEPYIRECIDSVCAQTYRNIEILAVNDGSTDPSKAVLEVAAFEDSRIRIFDKPNGGLSDARNYGLARANGEYICFIDGDDTIAEDYVGAMVQAIESEPDADICVCDMEYVYEDGHTEFSSGGSFTSGCPKENPPLIRINNSACNKLYRTSLFQKILFPKGKLYEDLATVPILLYESRKAVRVPRALYRYRQREGSIQHKTDRRVFHIYDAIDRVRDYVGYHGNEPEIRAEIMHMYVIFGLDITTLKIKDMERNEERVRMLEENMALLRERYPDYMNDPFVKRAGWKKRLIYTLLDQGHVRLVLKLYDR